MRSELLQLFSSLSGSPLLLRADCAHLPPLLAHRVLEHSSLSLAAACELRRGPRSDLYPLPAAFVAAPTADAGTTDEPWYVQEARAAEAVKIFGPVAVVPCRGMLWAGLDQLTAWCYGLLRPEAIQAACDLLSARPDITLVIFDCDSPGGRTTGIAETAAAVAALSAQKETVAFTAGMICSAMYWIASQCGHLACTPSATIGCIGTYTTIHDFSKAYEQMGITTHLIAAGSMKGQGTPGVPVKKEFIAFLQDNVDRINAAFLADCRAGRGPLADEDLQGQWFDGAQAVEKNLADTVVATRTEFLHGLATLVA